MDRDDSKSHAISSFLLLTCTKKKVKTLIKIVRVSKICYFHLNLIKWNQFDYYFSEHTSLLWPEFHWIFARFVDGEAVLQCIASMLWSRNSNMNEWNIFQWKIFEYSSKMVPTERNVYSIHKPHVKFSIHFPTFLVASRRADERTAQERYQKYFEF